MTCPGVYEAEGGEETCPVHGGRHVCSWPADHPGAHECACGRFWLDDVIVG